MGCTDEFGESRWYDRKENTMGETLGPDANLSERLGSPPQRQIATQEQYPDYYAMDLLTATTAFMRLAQQLTEPVFGHRWYEYGIPDPVREKNLSAVRKLRRKMLREEFHEYMDAEDENDVVEIVDGLLDIIVIAWGSLLAYVGEDKALAAAGEVVRSNLDKVLGEGRPVFRDDGKVLKPEGWIGPDIVGAIGQ